jgi:hypothetical protein
MAGDPKECRRNAARCAELMFLELSKNWDKLAILDAFAKLSESEVIRSNLKESRMRIMAFGFAHLEKIVRYAISGPTPPASVEGVIVVTRRTRHCNGHNPPYRGCKSAS